MTHKYNILVLTNNPSHAHGTILEKTFGKRPYTGVRATVSELILKYDDAEILIKRFGGGNSDSMRGYRFDEVWIDEYVWENMSKVERDSLYDNIVSRVGMYHNKVVEDLPHYAGRNAKNYFRKWE